MIITIKRTYHNNGTTGDIFVNNVYICNCIEQPWDDNKIGMSCIPEGEYEIELKHYGRYHNKWKDKDWYQGVLLLKNTEPRSEILIHPANYVSQIRGCIAPVRVLDKKDGVPCGWDSVNAFRELYDLIIEFIQKDDKVIIKIETHSKHSC